MPRTGEQIYHESNVIHFEPAPQFRFPGEVFVQIPDRVVPGVFDYYLISNYGRLWHKYNATFFNLNTDPAGYFYKVFKTVNGDYVARIHIVVKHVFDYNPEFENSFIVFNDGNKRNLFIGNLVYSECAQEFRPIQNSYSDDVIHEICRRLERRDCTLKVVADSLNVPYTLVQSVQGGYTRSDISSQYDIESRKISANLTNDEINSICGFFQDNANKFETKRELAEAGIASLGKNPKDKYLVKTAKKILGKETYTKISSQYNF